MSSNIIRNCILQINPKLYCCRLCSDTKYREGINLVDHLHLLKLLEYCVGFTVNIEYTSHVLCFKCKRKIEKFVEFKKQCEESENLWKKFPIANIPKLADDNNHSDLSILIKQHKTETKQECEELNTDEGFEGFNEISYDTKYFTPNQTSLINIEVDTCLKSYRDDKFAEVKCEDNTKTYECKNCKKKYSTHKLLLTHKRKKCCKTNVKSKHHPSGITENKVEKLSTNECGLCDKPLSSDVNEHILNHHWLNNNLQCGLCNYCGKDFAHMVTHRYTHCPNNVSLYCISCSKRSVSMLALQYHFRSVHLQKPGGYCTVCDKTFIKFRTWKKHHRMHTEINKLHVCDICGKKFLYRHEIKAHLTRHSEVRQYVCETCGKGFRRASALKDHIYNIHETRQPVKCEHCDKVYKCKNKLKIHLRNVAAEKAFICEVCSKEFHTETVLRKHMFWHTNERPFSCGVCGLTYKAKGVLKVHMRKHSGELPYVCAVCCKAFRSGNQLKVHLSVHTGVRRHKCMHCEKSFHSKKDLLLHGVRHKNIDVKLEPK
ncbi:zinc finger protein 26-like isoform X1 [Maniola hyperantus]|uniref:zinc finger protein 26-like isoform X1 n=1 Tax=Aphantopus hyperantus TaxID=2795564 RepID=UPI00156A1D73|nr:zinc finger protein 208-like [Maniola hyperantus]